ncbi:Variant surface glycoprotein [Trypanosoma congolense IL3000]|uniref:Variant surface glycoprotein n=1 Tax=Trypanosoma congolense (strain IL3000) TaxID=1068625 RepID=F9WDK7_TRYCI|nr:Variant surface glycoprotein [Trypanosoma congolense IL3000]
MTIIMRYVEMMMVGVMVIGADAKVMDAILDTSDFDLLCNVTKATVGLWNSVGQLSEFVDPDDEKEFSKTINKIFFGGKGSESHMSIWPLPDQFKKTTANRTKVCGYNSDSEETPSASDSLASLLLCLCTPRNEAEKHICGFNVAIKGIWPEDGKSTAVKGVFEEVWDGNGIEEQCKSHGSDDMEKEKQNVVGNITILEAALESKTELLRQESIKDKGKKPSAHVMKIPTWLKLLKGIQLPRKIDPEPQPEPPSSISAKDTEHESTAVTEMPPSSSAPETIPRSAPISPQVREENPEQETKRIPPPHINPQPEPKPKKKNTEVPEKPAENTEDPLPVPENETSSSFIVNRRWSLSAALLI